MIIKLPALNQALIFLPKEDCPQNLEFNLGLGEREYVSLLKRCQSMREVKQVHAQMLKCGLFWNPYCVSNLIATCALSNWGNMDYASSVFGQIDDPGSFEFNTMIRGHVKDGDFENALQVFVEMLEREISPDNFTLSVFCIGSGRPAGPRVPAWSGSVSRNLTRQLGRARARVQKTRPDTTAGPDPTVEQVQKFQFMSNLITYIQELQLKSTKTLIALPPLSP